MPPVLSLFSSTVNSRAFTTIAYKHTSVDFHINFLFLFSFVSSVFVITHWSIFMTALSSLHQIILTPLSTPSWHLWMVFFYSIYWLFEIFLVLGMMSDFWLKAGHLGYYVMRLWIFFKPCVLACCLRHDAGRAVGWQWGEVPPHYSQDG